MKKLSKLLPVGDITTWYDRLFEVVYHQRFLAGVIVFIGVPLFLIVAYINSPLRADTDDAPYSIFILAGQSNAAGVSSYRNNLAVGSGFDKQMHPADAVTEFWWAGSNGEGVNDAMLEALFPYYNGNGAMGWSYSGGNQNTASSQRLLGDLNSPQYTNSSSQTNGMFGSEFGIARTLYDMGRRKVIVLKVTYGFQSLGQSSSPLIPFDWNVNSTGSSEYPKSYQQLKAQFNQLTSYLNSQGKKYTVDGIFWMQGETDMLQTEYADAYQQNITDLVSAAKQDLQLHPQGHFVIGKSSMNACIDISFPRSGHYCDYPSAESIAPPRFVDTLLTFMINPIMPKRQEQVRAAQQYVADHDQDTSQKVDIFETNDLPRGYDVTHLTPLGQLELGRRFVTMYNLPASFTGVRADDYDQDGILNSTEDTGRGAACPLIINGVEISTANNGNLGDDDSDCDGYPNYLDAVDGPGSGL